MVFKMTDFQPLATCSLAFTFSQSAQLQWQALMMECSKISYVEGMEKHLTSRLKDGSEHQLTIQTNKGYVNITISFPSNNLPNLTENCMYEVEQIQPAQMFSQTVQQNTGNELPELEEIPMQTTPIQATCMRNISSASAKDASLVLTSDHADNISSESLSILDSMKALDGQDLGLTPPHSSTDVPDDLLLSDYPVSPLSFNNDHFLLETCGILAVPAQMDFDAFLEEAEKANLSPGDPENVAPQTSQSLSESPPPKDPVAFFLNSDLTKKSNATSTNTFQTYNKRTEPSFLSGSKDDLQIYKMDSMDTTFNPFHYPFDPDDVLLPNLGVLDNTAKSATFPQKNLKSYNNRKSEPSLFLKESSLPTNFESHLPTHNNNTNSGKPKSHSISSEFSYSNIPVPHFNLTPKQEVVFNSQDPDNVIMPTEVKTSHSPCESSNMDLMFPPNQNLLFSELQDVPHMASQYLNIEMPASWDKRAEAANLCTPSQDWLASTIPEYNSASTELQVKDIFGKRGLQLKAFDDYYVKKAPTLKELLTASDKGLGKSSKVRTKAKSRSRQKSKSFGSDYVYNTDKFKERSKSQTRASVPSYDMMPPQSSLPMFFHEIPQLPFSFTAVGKDNPVAKTSTIGLPPKPSTNVFGALSFEGNLCKRKSIEERFTSESSVDVTSVTNPSQNRKCLSSSDQGTVHAAKSQTLFATTCSKPWHTAVSSPKNSTSLVMKNLEHLQLEASIDQTLKMSSIQNAKKMKKEKETRHHEEPFFDLADFTHLGKTSQESLSDLMAGSKHEYVPLDPVTIPSFASSSLNEAHIMPLSVSANHSPSISQLPRTLYRENASKSLQNLQDVSSLSDLQLFDDKEKPGIMVSPFTSARSMSESRQTGVSDQRHSISHLQSNAILQVEEKFGLSLDQNRRHTSTATLQKQSSLVLENVNVLNLQQPCSSQYQTDMTQFDGKTQLKPPEPDYEKMQTDEPQDTMSTLATKSKPNVSEHTNQLPVLFNLDSMSLEKYRDAIPMEKSINLFSPGNPPASHNPGSDSVLYEADEDMEKNYNCTNCDEVFKSFDQLKLHEEKHADEGQKVYTCPVCQQVSNSEQASAQHEMTHYPRQYTCIPCGLHFQTFSERLKHEKTHGVGTFVFGKPHKCEECSEMFGTRQELVEHSAVHSTESTNTEVSGRSQSLDGEGIIKAGVIGKTLKRSLSASGQRTYVTVDPVFCEVCGKGFGSKSMLSHHRRTHSATAFIHHCSYCDKAFSEKSALTRHVRVHTQEKPYVCKYCKKAFNQSSTLNKHLRCHEQHNDFSANFLKIPVSHSCRVCGKIFKKKSDCTKHEKIHNKDRSRTALRCGLCEETFTSQADYNCHRDMHMWKGDTNQPSDKPVSLNTSP